MSDSPHCELEIARFAVRGGERLVHAAGAAMAESAIAMGLQQKDADHLRAATEALCHDVARQGFEHPDDAAFDVALIRMPGQLVVRVDDHGIPCDFQRYDTGSDSALGSMLRHGFADGLRLQSLGRAGNRAELFKYLPTEDVRSELAIEEHQERLAAAPVAHDEPIALRFLEPAGAVHLARCVWRSYGYSYDAEWVYQPERVAELIERGVLRSCVATAADGEIVGHLGLMLDEPQAKVGEAGQAVVDPRYRGHHLFTTLKRFMADWARDAGMYGLYSEATAAHPYSQKANLALGAHETGLLLGYIPITVDYRAINTAAGRRQSVALVYLKTNDGPVRAVHAPDQHRDMIARIYEVGGLGGEMAPAKSGAAPTLANATRLDVSVRRDHNLAVMEVREFGADFIETVEARLRDLVHHGLDCIYVDLPLAAPPTRPLGGQLESLGFFFGGVFPNRAADGDVLRLQYLNGIEVDRGDVAVASDFGQDLLDYVMVSRTRVGELTALQPGGARRRGKMAKLSRQPR